MTNPLVLYKNLRLFFLSRLASVMASQMLMVVLAWHIYELTGSAYDLGIVGLLQFLPSLALVFVAGHVADSFNRLKVLQLCMLGQLLIALALTTATMNESLSRIIIFIISFCLGIIKAFQMPTQQSILPILVPPAALPAAIAVNSAGMQTAIILGPAAGGFIYAFGAAFVYSICVFLFTLCILLLATIKISGNETIREKFSFDTVFAGLSFIWRRKEILGAISLDLFAVLLGGATALLPIFAKDILHVGAWGLGLLRSAPAVGALCTSIFLSFRPVKRNVGKVMFSSVAAFGLCNLVFAFSTSFILSLCALALSGAFDMLSVFIRHSLVQLQTPDHMRGRVSAVNSIFIGASNQLGEFESGITAGWFGAVASVTIGGIGTLMIVAGWIKMFPALLRRDALS